MTTTKYYGMPVVADYTIAANTCVLDTNSEGDLVCQDYDEKCNEKDEPMQINLSELFFRPAAVTEANITNLIKKQIGKSSILITESATEFIKRLASTF